MGVFDWLRRGERKEEEKKIQPVLENIVRTTVQSAEPQVRREGNEAHIIYNPAIPRATIGGGSEKNALVGRNLFSRNTRRVALGSDYDLAEVDRILETDSIFRKSVAFSTARAMRGEFRRVPNKQYPARTKRELQRAFEELYAEVERVLDNSQLTWYELIQTMVKELFHYGNTFVKKSRVSGKVERLITDDPLFYEIVVDPKTFLVKNYIRRPYLRPKASSEDRWSRRTTAAGLYALFTDGDFTTYESLRNLGYYNTSLSRTKEEKLQFRDVCHAKYMVEKNSPFAMPPVMPLLTDIQDMKTLEENLVFLGWQYGHPILFITVDCTNLTEPEAEQEIGKVRDAVENMESIGYLVASSRVKMELKYPNGSTVPLEKFVDYLSSKVSNGLDSSGLLLGDGSNAGRQAGEVIEAASNDIIYMVAKKVADAVEKRILLDIWRGMGNEDSVVAPMSVHIFEIDNNRRAAYVNQLVNMASRYIIPPNRMLELMGEQRLTKEEMQEIRDFADIKGPNSGNEPSLNPSNQYGEQTPGSTKN